MQVIDSWPHPSSRTCLARDQRLIHADNEVPRTIHLTRRPHQWCGLTEAAAIDLDALSPSRIVDAVADRLLRLGSGERIELHSSRDPYAVWQRMDRLRPGDYGFVHVQDRPDKWLVRVSRRQPAE